VVGLFEEAELNWTLWRYHDSFFGISDNDTLKSILGSMLSPAATKALAELKRR
jgi:hypothetical protein